MKLSSSIKFDSLILPILFVFFYDLPRASGSISGPKIAHPAICTGASGDLYWSDMQGDPSVFTGYAHRSFPVITGVAAASATVV